MTRQLQKLDIVAPGQQGLNREERARLLHPQQATVCTNFRLNSSGILATRKGITTQTSTPITATPNVETLFEYVQSDGTVQTIVAWDGGIANAIGNPEGNDVSGALTDTNGTWRMQNFNDKCLAFQAGQKLAIYTGSTFATVVEGSGTAPTSGIATCAFGRVWQVDNADGANLKYSGLLDETDWGGTGAGSIDFSNIWTDGQDQITAIAGFNGALLVFGLNHIVTITDGTGSELGLNPANAYVADVLHGTGCVDQNTLQAIGETDLIFLAVNGVQALSKLINERSNPTQTVSRNIKSDLLTAYRSATAGTIRSTYSYDEGIYWLSFPGDRSYAFDTRFVAQTTDGQPLLPAFQWDLAPTALVTLRDGTTLTGGAGEVFQYTGETDDGTAITVNYESGWLDFGEEVANYIKILKKIGMISFTAYDGDITIKWAVDFNTGFKSFVRTYEQSAGAAEWGVAEWGTDEWGPGGGRKIFKVPARGTGQYFKVGFNGTFDESVSFQQIELNAKIGRIA